MAYGDSAFGFGDPNQMALLGALAGLSQYAGASRLPQTFGQAIGGAAGGLMAGIGQGQKYQLGQEQVMSEQLKNTVALDLLRSQAAAMGAQVPTAEDIKKGYTIDWPEIFKKAYGGQSGAAPQLPTSGAQSYMSVPQQSEAVPPGAAGQELAGNTNLDSLTAAIHQLESGGRINGVPDSKAGAVGPMQIMPQTAAGYGVGSDALRQPEVNLSLGKHIISDLYQKYGGDPEAVAVAYNAGPGRADNWLAADRDNSALPKETQNYLAGLRDKLPQYAQNNVAAPSFTDASPSFTDATGAPASAPTILPEMNRMDAFRQLTLAQRMGNIPPAAQQYLQAQLVPAGAARNIAVASALKAAGIPLSIGGERPGVPQRVFAGFNAQGQPVYTIASQNPKSETGQLIGPNGELYYPKGTLSTIAQGTSTKKWAGVPAEMFQKGIAVQPGGGSVAPVPGYPQTQAATAGTTAQAVKAGEYAAEFGNLIPGAASPGIVSPGAAAGSQPGAEAAAALPAAGTRLGIDPGNGKAFTSNIPPVSTQVLPQSPAEAEASQKDWQTRKNEFADAVDPAQQAEERMLTQASIYKMIETGAWKENKALLAARLKSIGIPPELLKLDDPAAVETALHENYQGTLNYLKTVNNRFTQREFATLSEYNPNPNLQPAANQQLLAEGIAILRRDQALAKDWEVAQKHGWRNPVSFETQYMTANPIAPIVNSVGHEIGPLKGMAPNATASGAPYSPTGAGPAQTETAPKSAAPPNSAAPSATRTIGGTTYHKIGNQWFPEVK